MSSACVEDWRGESADHLKPHGGRCPTEGGCGNACGQRFMAEPPRDLNRSSDGDKAPARRGGRALPGPLKRLLTGRVSVQPFGASRGLSVPHIGERFRDDRVAGVGWRTLSACRT